LPAAAPLSLSFLLRPAESLIPRVTAVVFD
jgi:hypothetical protein